MFDLIFSLKACSYQKGEILCKEGDLTTSLFFLMRGEIEVSVKTGPLEFVTEKLFRGSIIDYRNFFQTTCSVVQYTFTKASIM